MDILPDEDKTPNRIKMRIDVEYQKKAICSTKREAPEISR